MNPRPIVAVLAAAVALGGCVSLFPKADPAQLYRFGEVEVGSASSPAAADPTPVSLGRVDFDPAAAGDRLLTVSGGQAAYIAEARWVSPAEVLFADALEVAFRTQAQRVRLVGRRDISTASDTLELDVRAFETRYLNGPDLPPTVVMVVDARLIRFPERALTAARTFEAVRPAGENRQTAIVAAYDAAVADLQRELVGWVDASVPAAG